MKRCSERIGLESCLGVRIGRVWTVGCPNDLEARASSLELAAHSERYRCRHAANSGVCAVAGAAEANVQPLGRWMTIAAVASRRAAGP